MPRQNIHESPGAIITSLEDVFDMSLREIVTCQQESPVSIKSIPLGDARNPASNNYKSLVWTPARVAVVRQHAG